MSKKPFRVGDILKVDGTSKNTGFVRVIDSDYFGLLIQLSDRKTGKFKNSENIVYVNPVSARKWGKIGDSTVDIEKLILPTFFYGSSATVWTIQSKEGNTYIKGRDVSFDELENRRFVLKVLWHGNSIKKFFDGKPLVWPFKF